MYKKLVVSAISALMLSTAAYADNVEGSVQQINQQEGTLQLSDGNTYKLPDNFDYSTLQEGAKVALTYDVDGETRVVSGINP